VTTPTREQRPRERGRFVRLPRRSPRGPLVARRAPSVVQSFNFAFEGVIHVLRTQRNMRIHFAIAIAVLALALAYDVTKMELIALMLAVSFVLLAEMVNTAVEATIDVATTSFDPLAKLAKDIAAGAVLIASVNAVAVGYLVFADRVAQPTGTLVTRVREAPINQTIIALVITFIVVVATKALTGRGTPLRGGLPSGHAAVAFAGWMAITFVVADYRHRLLVSTIAFGMALLVAQTRVESGIHSTLEVVFGGVIGTLVTLLLFQLLT
jgi:diacylglycerol kinase (ATP)